MATTNTNPTSATVLNYDPHPRSRWLMNENRQSVVRAKVAGLNLQGKQTKSLFFFSSEVQTTIFVLQFDIGSYSWQISKSFDEIKDFYYQVMNDVTLKSGIHLFKVSHMVQSNTFQL